MKMLREVSGSALIELSLIAPIFIMMTLSCIDVGLVLRNYIAAADSARAGAEYALVTGHEADASGWATMATYAAGSIPGYAVTTRSFCACEPGGVAVPCQRTCPGTNIAQYAEVTVTANLPLVYQVRGLPATIPIKSTARIRTKFTSGS